MVKWKRYLFFTLGIIFLGLSYVGIVMPGIPAIPFILISGWFFLNSSKRLFDWMLSKKIMGKVLRKFFIGEGAGTGMALFVISQLWVSLIVAQLIFKMPLWLYIVINLTGIIGSVLIYILTAMKRVKLSKEQGNNGRETIETL